MNIKNIPTELKNLDRWVACQNGIYPVTRKGKPAYCCQPSSWCNFAEAVQIANEYKLDSLAFAVMQDDPYVIVTFHDIVDLTTSRPLLQKSGPIRDLKSYTEFTYDHTGVRVIIRAKLPVGTSGLRKGHFEVFDRFRFVCLSGDCLADTSTIVEPRQDQMDSSWQIHFKGKKEVALEDNLSDEDLVKRACDSNANFRQLWNGQVDCDTERGDATIRLLRHLAYWTHRDPERMEVLYAKSSLCQKSWKRASFVEPSIRAALLGGVSDIPVAKVDSNKLIEEQSVLMAMELAAELKESQCPS